MKRSRSAFVALGLLVACPLVGLVAGCSSGDPQPKVAPSSPVSASASASSSGAPSVPVEPVMPAAAKKHTAAGAEAFVRFYWEMVNYAQSTGDVSGLTRLATEGCQACRSSVQGLQRMVADGAQIRGGLASVGMAKSAKLHAGGRAAFAVTAKVSTTREIIDYPKGMKDQVYPAGGLPLRFIVETNGSELRMAYWDRQP